LHHVYNTNICSIWGVLPADTGDKNNPASWTQLVVDENFDLSSEEAQMYIRSFCDELFEEDFASPVADDWTCPFILFDDWLAEQSISANATAIYTEHCAGATSLPVPEDSFDVCISNWALSVGETTILSRSEKVQIMFIPFQSRVRFDSPFDVLGDEWQLIEDWMVAQNNAAPEGVSRGYFNNFDWW
jgi:hypothetical protein